MSLPPTESKPDPVEKPAPLPLAKLPRTFLNRRWWWTTLLVIAGVLLLARLGVWQLDRLQQRRARNAEYLQQISTAPLQLPDDYVAGDPSALRDRPAEGQGVYDFDQQLVLVQQSWQGRPGVHLVTPLVFEGGEAAILVDRGWIPSAEAGDFTQFDEPGEQFVRGAIQLSQTLSGGRQTQVEAPQQEWYRIDIDAIQSQMPYELLPFFLLQSPPSELQVDLPYRLEPEIDLSDGPHLAYAIQWFLFAAILGIGYARFVSTH